MAAILNCSEAWKILENFRNYLKKQEGLQGELLSFLDCANPQIYKTRGLKALSGAEVLEEHLYLPQWREFTEKSGNETKL